MRVVIAGFSEYNKLAAVMEDLVAGSGCYLFTIVCGGVKRQEPSLAERWAREVGLPVEYYYDDNGERLLDKMATSADYIVADLGEGCPHPAKRLVMKMKSMGKHGTVVR